MVSTLDTLPAVSLCRGLCRSDGEPVACGGQFPRWCWLSVSDGVPVDWWPLDVLPVCEPVPWFVTCFFCGCFAVVLFRAHVLFMCVTWCLSACACGLVAAGMCCLWLSVPSVLGVGRMVRHSSSGEGVGRFACRMVCLWLSVPSVVLGVGCAACACGLVAVVCVGGMCCLWLLIGGRWDVLPVCEPVPWCRSDGVPQFQR